MPLTVELAKPRRCRLRDSRSRYPLLATSRRETMSRKQLRLILRLWAPSGQRVRHPSAKSFAGPRGNGEACRPHPPRCLRGDFPCLDGYNCKIFLISQVSDPKGASRRPTTSEVVSFCRAQLPRVPSRSRGSQLRRRRSGPPRCAATTAPCADAARSRRGAEAGRGLARA